MNEENFFSSLLLAPFLEVALEDVSDDDWFLACGSRQTTNFFPSLLEFTRRELLKACAYSSYNGNKNNNQVHADCDLIIKIYTKLKIWWTHFVFSNTFQMPNLIESQLFLKIWKCRTRWQRFLLNVRRYVRCLEISKVLVAFDLYWMKYTLGFT